MKLLITYQILDDEANIVESDSKIIDLTDENKVIFEQLINTDENT